MKSVAAASALVAVVATGSGATDLAVRLSLRPNDGATVEIAVTNETDRWLDTAVSSVLLLGGSDGKTFWAPFHPATGLPYDLSVRVSPGKPVPPEPKAPRLRLGPNESHRLVIGLRNLKWGLQISSMWPERKFEEVAPPGSYSLVWELATDDGAVRLRSTAITVEVPRK